MLHLAESLSTRFQKFAHVFARKTREVVQSDTSLQKQFDTLRALSDSSPAELMPCNGILGKHTFISVVCALDVKLMPSREHQ
jgi:hypothetical protein